MRLVDMRIPFSLSYAAVPEKKLFYSADQISSKVPDLWMTSGGTWLVERWGLPPSFQKASQNSLSTFLYNKPLLRNNQFNHLFAYIPNSVLD